MQDIQTYTLNTKYAIKVASDYVNDMKHMELCFVKFSSFRNVFIWCYREFVKSGLAPIENLDAETKHELFNTSLEWQPLAIPTDTRVALCRCIWTLNYVLDKYLRI